MALAMWAKSAAGTNLAFVKGFGKALKSWRELLQNTVLRKPAPKPKFQNLDVSQFQARERCLIQPAYQQRGSSTLQTRIFRSLFSRTTSRSLASELRRRSALRLSSSSARSFRHLPIMSLIGVTLGLDVSSVVDDSAEKMMSDMREIFRGYTWQTEPLEKLPQSLNDLEINLESIANGCEGAVYKAKVKADAAKSAEDTSCNDADFDLALKAVFNYGAESNALSIQRELGREIVPLRAEAADIDSELCQRVNRLPPHPNIVDMPGIFVDDMLVTEEGLRKFPAAMPHKLDPDRCYGRNKTLYLVMRRRSTHLRDYLANNDITMETRCLMLAQLLEGVAHLGNHGIAHRDLKTDNVLVDVLEDGGTPRLELCDFGCCLAEENRSLQIPYQSRDVYMGGNSWLMAPEVATATPGPNSVLDYRKSDLWAIGTIAYELLGASNPFYPSKDNSRQQLSSRTYTEDDLPALPDDVPAPIQRLVKALLSRDPKKRPTATVAAAVVQMVVLEVNTTATSQLAFPSTKSTDGVVKRAGGKDRRRTPKKTSFNVLMTKEREKLQWVLVQSLSLLCQLTFGGKSESWDMKSVMSFLFLSRLTYADFREAVKFF